MKRNKFQQTLFLWLRPLGQSFLQNLGPTDLILPHRESQIRTSSCNVSPMVQIMFDLSHLYEKGYDQVLARTKKHIRVPTSRNEQVV